MMIIRIYVLHIDPILNFVTAQVYTYYTGYNPREILDLVVAVVVVVVVVVVMVHVVVIVHVVVVVILG